MKFILAFDKFKGSLTSEQASDIAARAIREKFPLIEKMGLLSVISIPTADGGEGTVEAFLSSCGGTRVTCPVTPPHRTPGSDDRTEADFAHMEDGRCVLEMAAASGLSLVPAEERDPMHTSTWGTGEMIRAALELGAKNILLGLGGSATNDGGCGMASALGARFYGLDGEQIVCPTGADLIRIARIDLSGLDARLNACTVTACCDVDNPLCGESGAAAVYGPQKGARPEDIPTLDAGLANLAAILYRDHGIDIRHTPGAGAAGGMGGGVIAFLGGHLQSGIDAVLDAAGIDAHLTDADAVLTGEGKVDGQTVHGKVIAGVLRRTAKYSIPAYVFGGCVEREAMALYGMGASGIFSISAGPVPLEEAMVHAEAWLFDTVYAVISTFRDGESMAYRNFMRGSAMAHRSLPKIQSVPAEKHDDGE